MNKTVCIAGKLFDFKTSCLAYHHIEAAVKQYPNNPAISDQTNTLSYHALNARVNQLADYLKKQNISSQFIGICFTPSIDLIVALLANEQLQSVAMDEPGELYVSGECLSLGYWNKTEIRQDHFINHPLFPNEKMYKTGDIVKQCQNHLIEYLDRKDHQVKINGVRVD